MIQRCLLIAILALSTPAFAEPVVLKSFFDSAAGPNAYEVSFPPQLGGGTLFMPIVGGSFELETDSVAGTARLLNWSQEITPIDIFGKSTGDIVVTLEESSESVGTFDATANQFEVTGTFLITFDDSELREFGFFSPIALTGTEKGSLYGVGSIGTVSMFLEGGGLVAGSPFNYTCKTTAKYEYKLDAQHAQSGDVNHDTRLDVSDPVALLGSLFQGGSLACESAAEVNSDGNVDLSDAVFLLSFLFQGGDSPPSGPVACPNAP